MIWTVIGLIAATLTMFAFIPQIVKVVKTRSAKDVSLITVFQLMLGVSLWVIYGIHIRDSIIILANSVTLATLIILLFFYYSYEKAAVYGKKL